MPSKVELYYDLFCDHGLLGLAIAQERPDCCVIWNDINDVLVDRLQREKSVPPDRLIKCHAKDIALKPRAGVFLLGVGGHLMSECLTNWFKRGCLHSDQFFLFSPTYYQLSLRSCLYELGARLEARDFVWERNVGHELFLATFKNNKAKADLSWKEFDSRFWTQHLKEEEKVLDYLEKKYNSLSKNRHLSDWEKEYARALGHFLSHR